MRLHLLLCLLLLGSLAIHSANAVTDEDEENEDEEEDGVVEVEEEEPQQMKERVLYQRPEPVGKTHFYEPFDTRAEFLKRWVYSQAKKDDTPDEVAKYDGKWAIEEPHENPIMKDLALILKSKAKHHAIAAKLDEPFIFTDKPFIAQYEVRFQQGMDCGGAYMKLLSKQDKLNLKNFHDKTPYTIMFGPDKCGNDHKLHFIFRHKNPITGEFEEKHAEKPTAKLESFFTDKKTHLYTLTVRPDNSYETKIDNVVISTGNLLTTMSPPVNPPKEIEDPNDKKPADWDDREKISDPHAIKPDDWDETAPATIVDKDAEKPDGWLDDEEVYVPDPAAVKPADWDDDMDGEWEAPRIDNPKCKEAPGCGKWEPPTIANPHYKGTWHAPMIDNPAYKGEWKPKQIANPNYFEDKQPFKMTSIGAVGLELWAMTNDIVFDNFIISDNETIVEEYTAITWEVKSSQENAAASGGLWHSIKSSADERPWLWGVYAVVILLPIMLLSICLCPRSGPVKPEDIAAHRKKFDDPTPDTIPEEEEEEQEAEEEEAAVDEKDDVGAGGDAEEAEAEAEGATAAETELADGAGDGAEAEEVDDKDAVTAEGSPKKSNSPRKRKVRKE